MLALVGLLIGMQAPQAGADTARFEGISADGAVAFFTTTDQLVPGDTDNRRDVYERSYDETAEGYVTRQVSFGPSGGNNAFDATYLATEEAGEQVFFSTAERLTAADEDTATDIYVRDLTANKTTLVSAGDPSCQAAGCGNGKSGVGAVPGGVAADGSRVAFASSESLSPQDTDSVGDVYMRDLGAETTTLVSVGSSDCVGSECGNGPNQAFFEGASSDGSAVMFSTSEALAPADTDGIADIYQRLLDSGETKLVSVPGSCPGELDHNALYAGSSTDGNRVFFATAEQLVAGDSDAGVDIYVRTGGTVTELVSAGNGSCEAIGFCDKPAALRWVSPSGSIAVLSTQEPLTAGDEDESFDVYQRALPGGPTTLLSRPGPTCSDPECGKAAKNANFAGASSDGSHIFFITDEALAPPEEGDPSGFGDTDTHTDVYERSGGATSLVSIGQPTEEGVYRGNDPLYPAQLHGVSDDGETAFFVTRERLTESDNDTFDDVYQRAGGATLLVSRGNDAELEEKLAPPTPVLEGTDPPSPNASTEPRVLGSEANASASIKIYATADCSGEAVATGSAAELAEPGIAVTVGAGSTTTFRATAEAEGFVSSCSAPLAYTQEDPSPPPGGDGGGGSGDGGGGGGGGGGSAPPVAPAQPLPAPAPPRRGISYVMPATRITFGPASKTRARRPVFRFRDATGQPGTRFLCKIDRRRWSRCSSPVRLKRLARGRHVFRVLGINARGRRESRPSKRRFKLVGKGRRHRGARRHRRGGGGRR